MGRLLDAEPALLGQVGQQLSVGALQGGAGLADHLGQLAARESQADDVAEELADAEAGVKPDDEAVRKAQSFRAKPQRADGAWAMASRAILSSGKPATNLEPITHAGSAWAVMGLVRSFPQVAKAGRTATK